MSEKIVHGRVKLELPHPETSDDDPRRARTRAARCTARVEDFVTESTPRLMKNVLASWNVERCREWLEDDLGLELGIEHVSNKYFPLSNSSKEVRDKLLRACEQMAAAGWWWEG